MQSIKKTLHLVHKYFLLLATTAFITTSVLFAEEQTPANSFVPPVTETPFVKHGKLRVDGTQLVDKNDEPYQLYGMSTHGIAWYPMFINEKSFTTLRDSWNTNCVRISMYTYENGGYCSGGNKEQLKKTVQNAVSYATNLGMYVIIDWHILNDHSPLTYKDDAKKFFLDMSKKYAKQDNVIYEICNEPNECSWTDITDYAKEIIPVIRKNNKNAIILVGTPTWSQDVDEAMYEPLDFDNIMYVVHFYAATHTYSLRSKVETAIENGIPVFISEFGMCTADGQGKNNFKQAQLWFDLIDKYKLSFFCWNLSNGRDTCCVLKPTTRELSDWTDDELSESGEWIVTQFRKQTNR